MATTHVSLPAIENAIREVCFAIDENDQQSPSWDRMTEDDLWRELVACILGSRVRFEVAHSAVERIEKRLLLCQERRSSQFDHYERDVLDALSGKTRTEAGADTQSRYPFFRIRANQIRRAAERLYGNRGSVREFLDNSRDIRDARRRLVSEVPGLGPKQASLFLRNIGYVTNVAVLDVHVLTYMSWVGLTDTLVKSVSTIRKYEMLEDSFIEHSCSFGYTPDRFDLAVWVVVKVVKEEYKSWG
jgi:N-glycosylase/DNA lyase